MAQRKKSIEVIVRGLAINHRQEILFCQNLKRGYFFLPGGHVEFGETAREALGREFHEEAGIDVRVGSAVAFGEELFKSKGRLMHEVNMVFRVEPTRGRWRSLKVDSKEPQIGFVWLGFDEIGCSDVRPSSVRRWTAGDFDPSKLTWIEGRRKSPNPSADESA